MYRILIGLTIINLKLTIVAHKHSAIHLAGIELGSVRPIVKVENVILVATLSCRLHVHLLPVVIGMVG